MSQASAFFLGVMAALAMLITPSLVLGLSPLEIPRAVSAFVGGTPVARSVAEQIPFSRPPQRPIAGYVAGAPTPTEQPLPALASLVLPTPRPTPPPTATPYVPLISQPTPAESTGAWYSTRLLTAERLRRTISLERESDPVLPAGSPVVASRTRRVVIDGIAWRYVQAVDSIATGWVPVASLLESGEVPAPPVRQVPTPASGALSPAARAPAGPTSVASSGRSAPPTPAAAGERVVVANTDGEGVVLRASPRMDDRTPRGFLEGAQLTVLAREGADWLRVRGANGLEGWVPARYVLPLP